MEKSKEKRHKKKSQYSIKEGWLDSKVIFNKRDFYQNFSELIVSQLFSTFFDHKYKSKRSISQILRSGGLYQDRIMEEKPIIENVCTIEYKFNSAFLCFKKTDINRPIVDHKFIAQRCHMISQSQYQKDYNSILKQDRFLSKNIIERMMLMLWLTEKSTVLSYNNTKPKEYIRNEVINTNYSFIGNKEVFNNLDNLYEISYKRFDKNLNENVLVKINSYEFFTIRNKIREMYDFLKDPFINIPDFFEEYKVELDIISDGFDNHISNYKDFCDISNFIKNNAKSVFDEMKNYTNTL